MWTLSSTPRSLHFIWTGLSYRQMPQHFASSTLSSGRGAQCVPEATLRCTCCKNLQVEGPSSLCWCSSRRGTWGQPEKLDGVPAHYLCVWERETVVLTGFPTPDLFPQLLKSSCSSWSSLCSLSCLLCRAVQLAHSCLSGRDFSKYRYTLDVLLRGRDLSVHLCCHLGPASWTMPTLWNKHANSTSHSRLSHIFYRYLNTMIWNIGLLWVE